MMQSSPLFLLWVMLIIGCFHFHTIFWLMYLFIILSV